MSTDLNHLPAVAMHSTLSTSGTLSNFFDYYASFCQLYLKQGDIASLASGEVDRDELREVTEDLLSLRASYLDEDEQTI